MLHYGDKKGSQMQFYIDFNDNVTVRKEWAFKKEQILDAFQI